LGTPLVLSRNDGRSRTSGCREKAHAFRCPSWLTRKCPFARTLKDLPSAGQNGFTETQSFRMELWLLCICFVTPTQDVASAKGFAHGCAERSEGESMLSRLHHATGTNRLPLSSLCAVSFEMDQCGPD
jgi:hypothetical protein